VPAALPNLCPGVPAGLPALQHAGGNPLVNEGASPMEPHLAQHHALRALVAEIATRAAVAVGLAAIALIHLLDSIGKWSETRYVFWMYVALMLGCVATAGWVAFTRSRLALLAAAGIATSALIGYVLSRSVGLPHATGDIGNWTEPLGLASLFVEGAVIAAALVGHRMAAAAAIPVALVARRELATAA
jgi:hypothetical protein